jgi:glycosyltransferase involved in cell wall biosynthesis
VGHLRVGLDGRAFSSPAAGVRRYVGGLVPALRALGAPLDVVVLGGSRDAAPPGIEYVAEPMHPPTNLGWTLVGLALAARRARVDVLHAPAYTAPIGLRTPVVVTVHDVSYERHPEWYPYRRDGLRRAFYRASARAAAQVLTDSTFSQSEIHAAYGIPLDRISIVPLGVVPRFGDSEDGDGPRDVVASHGGPPVAAPFVLHVGDLHARRNLGVVLDAVLALRRRGGAAARLTLVLAGTDRGLLAQLQARAEAAGSAPALTVLGVVSDARLEALYRQATALVYPSLYEGFGLPVLEAMARGTPVLASRAASMPEVLGEAGMLIDPVDVHAWIDALAEVIGSPDRRAAMKAAGMARAAGFTWERTARATLDVYQRVARR